MKASFNRGRPLKKDALYMTKDAFYTAIRSQDSHSPFRRWYATEIFRIGHNSRAHH